MNFSWNIFNWLNRYLVKFQAQSVQLAWLRSLLKPVQELHTDFIQFNERINQITKYNSQQKVFASLLNKVFDNDLKRIRIVTSTESKTRTYIFYKSESKPLKNIYFKSEDQPRFIYSKNEILLNSTFIVYAPLSISVSESRLRAFINLYKLANTNYTIIYE